METNCSPPLAYIFRYSYEAKFIQSVPSIGKRQFPYWYYFTNRFIYDIFVDKQPQVCELPGPDVQYSVELEINDTSESNNFCFLPIIWLFLSIGRNGQLQASIYDKRGDFNFHINNVPFSSSNIFFLLGTHVMFL